MASHVPPCSHQINPATCPLKRMNEKIPYNTGCSSQVSTSKSVSRLQVCDTQRGTQHAAVHFRQLSRFILTLWLLQIHNVCLHVFSGSVCLCVCIVGVACVCSSVCASVCSGPHCSSHNKQGLHFPTWTRVTWQRKQAETLEVLCLLVI